MAAVTICSDFGAPQNKVDTVSTVSPSISHEVKGPDAMIFILEAVNIFLYFLLRRLLKISEFLVCQIWYAPVDANYLKV